MIAAAQHTWMSRLCFGFLVINIVFCTVFYSRFPVLSKHFVNTLLQRRMKWVLINIMIDSFIDKKDAPRCFCPRYALPVTNLSTSRRGIWQNCLFLFSYWGFFHFLFYFFLSPCRNIFARFFCLCCFFSLYYFKLQNRTCTTGDQWPFSQS